MNNWIWEYSGWDPDKHPLREALCTLGNGYFATRGAMEESTENDFNYPGTYLACGYNRAVSTIKGRDIENEDLVNWPNWLSLTFKAEDSDWLDLTEAEVSEYIIRLKIKEGVFERRMRFKDKEGRETVIISRRIVSMHDPHVAAIEWTLIPENWSGKITVRSGIDGSVTNNGVPRYRKLNGHHLDIVETGSSGETGLYLVSQTKQSKIRMAQAISTRVSQNGTGLDQTRENTLHPQAVWQDITFHCKRLQPVNVEKILTVFTSRDFAISDPLIEARNKVQKVGPFREILHKHTREWELIWTRNGFETKPDNNNLLILRLHAFHIHQTVSMNSMGYDIGVPSRGWHGEAYRGHIFWDELYIFPYINLHMPQLARSLLLYRYRRLPEAREAAKKNGYKGAMYPWQSGSNGREESQVIHLNPESGRWIPDHSRLQRHINAAIPYNVWQYYQATYDMEFLTTYGAEIILNTALFWSSISEYNPKIQRYEIRGVMGPDEYHTHYPGSDTPGLNNNAYTNFMAVWVVQCALNLIDMFDDKVMADLAGKVGFTRQDIDHWKKIVGKMYIPFNEDHIILQFDGFDQLQELDWNKCKRKYGEILRLDRILEKENDSPNHYRAAKQADVLMLFYLFSTDHLVAIFNKLGYDFKPEYIQRNIQYYHEITSHGSTLSQVIFSWVQARSDRKGSWGNFQKALMSDVKDVQGGTTPEGIHLGAMAGTVDIMQRCYTGLEIRDDVLYLKPKLPHEVHSVKMQIRFRSHWITLRINHEKIVIDFDRGWAGPVEINVRGKQRVFEVSDHAVFELTK